MKRLVSALVVLVPLLLGVSDAGTITTREFESATLGRLWKYNVYLPDEYGSSGLEYPVLYLLHGSGGDESDWDEGMAVLDELIAANQIPPVIAVAPSSGSSWWVDSSESFETAVIDDLIPHVDSAYRTIAERGGRAVVGFSMGGYGAIRYALAYPGVFRTATLLSPALYADQPPPESSARSTGAFGRPFDSELWSDRNYPSTLASYRRSGLQVPVFIAVGDDDWNEPAGWEYNVEYQAVLLFEQLNKVSGSPAELRIVNGGHDWDAWRPMFAESLRYTFRFLRLPRPLD